MFEHITYQTDNPREIRHVASIDKDYETTMRVTYFVGGTVIITVYGSNHARTISQNLNNPTREEKRKVIAMLKKLMAVWDGEPTLTDIRNPEWHPYPEEMPPHKISQYGQVEDCADYWVYIKSSKGYHYVTKATLYLSPDKGIEWDCVYDSCYIADDETVEAWTPYIDNKPEYSADKEQ